MKKNKKLLAAGIISLVTSTVFGLIVSLFYGKNHMTSTIVIAIIFFIITFIQTYRTLIKSSKAGT